MRKADNAAFRERATFLTDYACWLFGCGATCTRMEKNVARMAEVFGMHVEIYIMPRHLHLAISDLSGSDTSTFIVTPRPTPINFTVNTQLSRLSWDVADGK
ncbi:MAG: threonine/serine exporter family protein, partial [Muribaculaceae bacterium]|nr:threonine/serine exporter family protein [Muribaculaceae bacterium]